MTGREWQISDDPVHDGHGAQAGQTYPFREGDAITHSDVHPSPIPASDPHPRRRVRVLDAEMSYVDVGEGKADRLPPRQPDVLVPLAQRDPPRCGARAVPRARPREHGALEPFAIVPPRVLRSRRVLRRLVRGARAHARRDLGRARLGIGARVLSRRAPPRADRRDRVHGSHRPMRWEDSLPAPRCSKRFGPCAGRRWLWGRTSSWRRCSRAA